jgi:dCMP deaminase
MISISEAREDAKHGVPLAGSPWNHSKQRAWSKLHKWRDPKREITGLNKEQQAVFDFHAKYGAIINTTPTIPDLKTLILRARLICEEAAEFLAAVSKENMVEMADSLADILYVVYGTAVALGINLEPIFAEVQRSNMTKDGGGKDSGGKIIKGPNYEPPEIERELKKQGWVDLVAQQAWPTNVMEQMNMPVNLPIEEPEPTSPRPSWDVWFLTICHIISTRSHDPSTKHGAILCDSNHRILGVGYNGYPRGSNDSKMPVTRPEKYDVFLHAENNCLLNSPNLLMGSNYTMYLTGPPCPVCFISMVQAGVKRIIHSQVQSNCVPQDKIDLVQKLAKTYGVEIVSFNATESIKKLLARAIA